MNTNQSIDERCAELAERATDHAVTFVQWRADWDALRAKVPAMKTSAYVNCLARLVREDANRIIALRTAQYQAEQAL